MTDNKTQKGIVLNYVWIDGFRDLNNVGFNLGGEYRYKVEKKENGQYELSQADNDKYVEGFFSFKENNNNNISLISAIVGNNGAGKTSMLRALRSILLQERLGGNVSFDYLIIYSHGIEIYYYHSNQSYISILNKNNLSKVDKLPENLFTVFYSSMIDGNTDFLDQHHILNLSFYSDEKTESDFESDVSSNRLIYKKGSIKTKRDLDLSCNLLDQFSRFETELQIDFLHNEDIEKKDSYLLFKRPTSLTVFFEDRLLLDKVGSENDKGTWVSEFGAIKISKEQKNQSKQLSKNSLLGKDDLGSLMPELIDLIPKIESKYKNNSLDELFVYNNKMLWRASYHLVLDSLKLLQYVVKPMYIIEAYRSVKLEIETLIANINIKTYEEAICTFIAIVIHLKRNLDSGITSDISTNNIIESLNCLMKENFKQISEIKRPQIANYSFNIPIEKYESFLEISMTLNELLTPMSGNSNDRFNEDKLMEKQRYFNLFAFDWSELSTGEKLMLNLFSRFHYAKKKMEEFNPKDSSILILIDEGELGFHLEWQRRYINALVEILPLIFEKHPLQIIFTTHSPVSLSDIPRDNVVFLRKEKTEEGVDKENVADTEEGKYVVKVVEDPINTFGANIHSIMRNGFFLENGTMGEFARKKIEQLFNNIQGSSFDLKDNNTEAKIERYRKQIALIDEPILRQSLDRLLLGKYTKAKDENNIELFMEKQIKYYQEELDRFRNQSKKN